MISCVQYGLDLGDARCQGGSAWLVSSGSETVYLRMYHTYSKSELARQSGVGEVLGDFLEEKACWAQTCWCGGVWLIVETEKLKRPYFSRGDWRAMADEELR